MAKQKIFLHVGSPKTGTTFLQQVVWSQRERAEQQGVYLPLNNFHEHFFATLDLRGLADNPVHPPEAAGSWGRIIEQAHQLPGSVLVSHELFAAVDQVEARRAVGFFGVDVDVHVVVTARDLVRQLTAEWQEHVKHRSSMSLEEFVASVRANAPQREGWFWLVQDYAAVAKRWGGRLDPANVHIVTVPPSRQGGSVLWERFAGLIGLDPGSFEIERSRANPSMGHEQSEVLRRANLALGDALPIPGPYPGVAKDVLAHQILAPRSGTKLGLTRADADFAVAESTGIAEAIAAAGFDVVGSLDDLVPSADDVEAVVRADAYVEPADGPLVEEAVAAIAGLMVAMGERNATIGELRGKVAELEAAQAALAAAPEEVNPIDKARQLYRRFRA